jgi:hypothetical protein
MDIFHPRRAFALWCDRSGDEDAGSGVHLLRHIVELVACAGLTRRLTTRRCLTSSVDEIRLQGDQLAVVMSRSSGADRGFSS